MHSNTPELQAFIDHYKDDRSRFVYEVLKVIPELWQLSVLNNLDNGSLREAIKSGHGVGKSALLSWVIIHFMITRFPQKTVVTAPTAGQLFDALAAEVKHWINRLPPVISNLFDIKAERIVLKSAPADSFIAYRTSRQEQPEALQGIHADYVLLVVDEASGVPNAVYEAAGGSLSTPGAILILASNPTRAEGYFYNIFRNQAPNWGTHTVSGEQSSRVDPAYAEEIERQEGGRDNNVYRVRCLGEFPTFDEDKLIPFYLIEEAINREVTPDLDMQPVWGLDVARTGNDRSALVVRTNRVILDAVTRRETDLMQLVGWVKNRWDEAKPTEKPAEILVDAIGLGAGVADRLSELGLPAVAINVAEVSALNPQAARLRDDLWIQTRDWFARQDVSIPDIPALTQDLQAPTMAFTSSGKLKVASKEEMKRAGFKSPDLGDALALTFAGEAQSAMWGSEGNTQYGWKTPLPIEKLTIV